MRCKPKIITQELKLLFNERCMREFKLDCDEDTGLLCDYDTEELFYYNEKYIKVPEDDTIYLEQNEIELDFIRNPRLMEIFVKRFLEQYQARTGIYVNSTYQSTSTLGERGYYAISYLQNGVTREFASDMFFNESVRMFNLVCKLNNTAHMYDFNTFDILEIRK